MAIHGQKGKGNGGSSLYNRSGLQGFFGAALLRQLHVLQSGIAVAVKLLIRLGRILDVDHCQMSEMVATNKSLTYFSAMLTD